MHHSGSGAACGARDGGHLLWVRLTLEPPTNQEFKITDFQETTQKPSYWKLTLSSVERLEGSSQNQKTMCGETRCLGQSKFRAMMLGDNCIDCIQLEECV